MESCSDKMAHSVLVTAQPGICGFNCEITARLSGRRKVTVTIAASECKQVQRLAGQLTEITVKELFLPFSRNPVYQIAEKMGCHSSCVVPAAVLKAVEAAMGMAVAKDAGIRFQCAQTDSRQGLKGS